jgi:type II secretory ATPase GspE/PulE/Tfp pilus assembly ATPase PilB-like protein
MDEISSGSVLTAKGAQYELPQDLRAKMVLLGDGSILVDENYRNDISILTKIAFYKNIQIDGKNLSSKDKVQYVTPDEVQGYYSDSNRFTALKDANHVQKRIIDLIAVAFAEKVTDIHIELRAPSTYIQFRKLGSLKIYQQLTYEDGLALSTTLYNSMTLSSATNYNPRTQQDGNMRLEFLPEGLAGIRIATGPTQGGNAFMVLRLLPIGQNMDLRVLGYAKSQMKSLEYCNSAHAGGITLVCGPTGSGKSTTLQLLAKKTLLAAKGQINFLTIEDPVEYPIIVEDYVEQLVTDPETNVSEVKTVKVTYAARQIAIQSTDDAAIKKQRYQETVIAAMRQDPDIIMIGEIRDVATADAAITASNTGHPVISTVHARNAQMIIDRLITIGADRNLLLSPDMITGLFAQHLVPELCPKCKRKLIDHKDDIDSDLLKRLEDTYKDHGGLDGIYINSNSLESSCGYYDEENDRMCYNGHIGRFVIAESILPDEKYLQYMRDNQMYEAYRYWIEHLHGYTMMCHGMAKVKHGLLDPQALESKLKQICYQDNLAIAIADV